MMRPATTKIYNAIANNQICKLNVNTEDNERNSRVWLEFNYRNSNNGYRVDFISADDRNDAGVRIFEIAHVPEEKRVAAYELLNQLNSEFRYFKFVMDQDGDINAHYDFLDDSNVEDCVMELLGITVNLMEDIYPRIMKMIWS